MMAQAPRHAATKYKKWSTHMTTLQYCIPSYTSTIRALQYSRSKQIQLTLPMQNVLIVIRPTKSGERPLDVDKGADNVKHCMEDNDSRAVRIMRMPTSKQRPEILPNYSIAHFACHGVSSMNPGHSHLMLAKESTLPDGHCEEVLDKLCVKDVAALKLPAARLAYISACS